MPHPAFRLIASLVFAVASASAGAHGDVTPQAVDVTSLPAIGKEWQTKNPYSANKEAIRVGSSAYNQNCARCHGLEAISGGIAPDLRKLDLDCHSLASATKKNACYLEVDQYFTSSVRKGKTRNGAVYMPPFEDILSQEAVWAIKAYLETRREQK